MSRGFTLIELAVAVVIACIATAIALPSLTPSSPQVRLDGDAAALAGMVRSARQYAVLARRPTGVRVTESGAHALRWDGAAWQPLPGHALAAARFANSTQIEWRFPVQADDGGASPQIMLTPAGTMAPFELFLRAGSGALAGPVRIVGEPTGRVRLEGSES